MQSPIEHNLSVVANDTLELLLELRNPEGDPIDLTGAAYRMQIRRGLDLTLEPIQTLVLGEGITVADPTTGDVQILAVATMPPGQYLYEFQTTQDQKVRTHLRGILTVEPEIAVDDPD